MNVPGQPVFMIRKTQYMRGLMERGEAEGYMEMVKVHRFSSAEKHANSCPLLIWEKARVEIYNRLILKFN